MDEIIARMKPVYDGYCFSQESEHTVFNSSMCLYYLKKVQQKQKFLSPEDYLDPASDQDGSKLQQLFDIAEDGLTDEVIKNYLEERGKVCYLQSESTKSESQHVRYTDASMIPKDVECVIALGGDGTLLHRKYSPPQRSQYDR